MRVRTRGRCAYIAIALGPTDPRACVLACERLYQVMQTCRCRCRSRIARARAHGVIFGTQRNGGGPARVRETQSII